MSCLFQAAAFPLPWESQMPRRPPFTKDWVCHKTSQPLFEAKAKAKAKSVKSKAKAKSQTGHPFFEQIQIYIVHFFEHCLKQATLLQ